MSARYDVERFRIQRLKQRLVADMDAKMAAKTNERQSGNARVLDDENNRLNKAICGAYRS